MTKVVNSFKVVGYNWIKCYVHRIWGRQNVDRSGTSIDASYIGYRVSLVQVSPSYIEIFTDIRVYALVWKLHTSHATTLMMAVVLLSCGLS